MIVYRIFYERRVFKDLDKIPNIDVERIREVLKGLAGNPRPFGVEKLSGKEGLYRVKQGNYRIVYTISSADKEIRIILIRHRRESYRNL